MEKKQVKRIVELYIFPTEGTSYMGGLENRPVIARSEGRTVWDTDGKAYLDLQLGQMGAALGHQHPRMVKRIRETMDTFGAYCRTGALGGWDHRAAAGLLHSGQSRVREARDGSHHG